MKGNFWLWREWNRDEGPLNHGGTLGSGHMPSLPGGEDELDELGDDLFKLPIKGLCWYSSIILLIINLIVQLI